jgi:methylenetetrahydrofolate reductase (NADPH)
MMPIQSYSSFQRMTQFCRTKVPDCIWQDLGAIRDDDDAVKAYGIKVCADICKKLHSSGVPGFHFYTLNLERSVLGVLKELGVDDASSAARRYEHNINSLLLDPRLVYNESLLSSSSLSNVYTGRHLPWRGSRTTQGGTKTEDVRPINWANRPKSYIKRTNTWDEFPNGRWGDGRSPAFGELSDSHFFRPTSGSPDDRRAMWGMAPIVPNDIYETFAKYIEGRIPVLPWCETPLQPETSLVANPLVAFNRAGLLSINSQPAVNGERSDHQIFGWGGAGGRVYQRAYLEFFTSPENLKKIVDTLASMPNLSYYAVNASGEFHSNVNKGVTALTWGVFPNKEIQQPTIFDPDTFVVWSQEAFQLWTSAWASLYDDETESCELLYNVSTSIPDVLTIPRPPSYYQQPSN